MQRTSGISVILRERGPLTHWPALIAAATTAAYAGMKVVYAIEGKLGLPGFPAPASHYAGKEHIGRAEWGNAALAGVAMLIALATLHPLGRRIPRWLLAVTVWIAFLALGSGAVGFTLRATRLLPDLGPPPTGWVTWAVLVILDTGAVAWAITSLSIVHRDAPNGRRNDSYLRGPRDATNV